MLVFCFQGALLSTALTVENGLIGRFSNLFKTPFYYIAGENGFKFEHFNTFFQALHYMQKKSDFGGPFFERFVHLYLAFVTIHKIYFEFLCKNFYLLTTVFHTFLRIESKFFQFCSFAQMNGPDFVVIAKGFVEGDQRFIFPSTT